MNTSQPGRRSWIGTLLAVGVSYALIGVVFPTLDHSPDGRHVILWRLAAWMASAAVGVSHIVHEHRRGSAPRVTALRAAGAVALGGFGLAVAANVHWLMAGARAGRPPLLALPIWPIITALPVFPVAWAAAALLARWSRRA